MRYADTHKAQTRTRLLEIAARGLRAEGPERLSIAEVMREAGLTHGGFYAHFRSKDALLADAVDLAFAQGREKMAQATAGLPPREALAAYIDSYVSRRHRDGLAQGCPITALNSDPQRQDGAFREHFEAGVKRLIAWLSDLIAAARCDGDPQALAASTVAAMAGAVAVSRTIADHRLSDQMLVSARDGIKARLGLSDL